jgi:hypothetical protein
LVSCFFPEIPRFNLAPSLILDLYLGSVVNWIFIWFYLEFLEWIQI